MKKIAILIPCYNEARTICDVVKSFKYQLPEADIYVYDNNSTDDSKKLAESAGAIVRSEHEQGKGNVVRRMFREINADCYVMVDADMTYPAESVHDLISGVLNDDCDMVIGDRLSTTYFGENKRPFHNMGNRLVRYMVNKMYKSEVHDIMTGYRAFSKRFVKLFPVMSSNFEIETEMTIHSLDKRFRIKEVPIHYKDRPSGSESKLDTINDGRRVILTIITLFREYKPMAFFGWVSVLLLCLFVCFFVQVLIEYLHTGLVPRFPTLIFSFFLGQSSLLCFFTGLCLDVIISKDRKSFELEVIQYEEKGL